MSFQLAFEFKYTYSYEAPNVIGALDAVDLAQLCCRLQSF